jgi:hypothetical protein
MKDIKKDLIVLANHLDDKGFNKEADYLDKVIKGLKKEAILMDRLEELFERATQAYYRAITESPLRNFYAGDDAEVAQRVINEAREYFEKNDPSPSFPDDIIKAGMFVEAGPATLGDTWFGESSLFKVCLKGGNMRSKGFFSTGGAERSAELWTLFVSENERQYMKARKEYHTEIHDYDGRQPNWLDTDSEGE